MNLKDSLAVLDKFFKYFFDVLLLLLIGVQYFKERLVNVGLVGEAALYLIYIVDGMSELDLVLGILSWRLTASIGDWLRRWRLRDVD